MVDEIARIGVAVDSTSAVGASKDLEALATSGDKVADSAKKMSGTVKSETAAMAAAVKAQAQIAIKELNAQKEVAVANAKAQAAEQRKLAQLASAQLREQAKADRQAKKEQAAADRQASKERIEIAKAEAKAQAEILRIQKQMRAAELKAETAALKANASIARSNTVAQANANKVLAASHHQVSKAAVGYTKSAKEMAFATRNLPAQFTDIAVSLQAGQNPMTVLLQQGGQLKDMFGGIGPAVKAMGGYVMGLVNPFTLAAAAAITLFTAWAKGESEVVRLNKALASTSGQAGVTQDAILRMSEAMNSGKITQSAAVDGLEAVAKNGKIAGAAFEMVATAAVNMNRVTGKEIEETVSEFASLGKEPVQAVLRLNEEHQFLTTTVYEQIKALEEQGRTAEATRVAQEAYANSVNEKAAAMEAQLGTLEWAWSKVKIGAKAAWDAMLDIGRPDSGAAKFNEMHQNLQRLEETAAAYGPGKSPEWLNKRIDTIREDMRKLSDANVEEQKKANRRALRAEADLAAIELDQRAISYSKGAEKRAALIKQAEGRYNDLVFKEKQLGGKDLQTRLARLAEDQAKVLAGINEQYKDPKPKKSKGASEVDKYLREQMQEYDRFNKSLQDHRATLEATAESQDRLTSFERWAAKALAELDSGTSKLTATQKANIKQGIEAVRVLDQQNQERERQNRILQNTIDLTNELAQDEAAQKRSMAQDQLSYGRGQNEAGLEAALEDIRYRAAMRRMEIDRQHAEEQSSFSADHLADLARINEAEERMAANEIRRLEQRKAAMGDWRNGARSAMEDIAWEMGDVAGRTRDSFMTVFGAMNSALTTFANTGKVKIRDFATVVIAELLRIALTIATSKILQMFFTPGGAGGASVPTIGPPMANGGVFGVGSGTLGSGGGTILTPGANGGILTSATLRPFAGGGMALLGEERPEAVLPLKRGPNGKLGVQSNGGGGNTSVITNITINNDGSSTSETKVGGDDQQAAKSLAAAVESKVREVLNKERRQGGILWQMQYGS